MSFVYEPYLMATGYPHFDFDYATDSCCKVTQLSL